MRNCLPSYDDTIALQLAQSYQSGWTVVFAYTRCVSELASIYLIMIMIDNSNENDDNNNNNYNSSSTNLHELFSIHRQLPLLPDNSDKSLSYISSKMQ